MMGRLHSRQNEVPRHFFVPRCCRQNARIPTPSRSLLLDFLRMRIRLLDAILHASKKHGEKLALALLQSSDTNNQLIILTADDVAQGELLQRVVVPLATRPLVLVAKVVYGVRVVPPQGPKCADAPVAAIPVRRGHK